MRVTQLAIPIFLGALKIHGNNKHEIINSLHVDYKFLSVIHKNLVILIVTVHGYFL